MGARGNSGVILSQIWRGFARALDEHPTMDVQILTNALKEAEATAYKGETFNLFTVCWLVLSHIIPASSKVFSPWPSMGTETSLCLSAVDNFVISATLIILQ